MLDCDWSSDVCSSDLERLARSLELADALAGVEAVAPSGATLAADPEAAIALLADVCRQAAAGVDAVILGGAGLAGYHERLRDQLPCPLIDSVDAGVDALLAGSLDAYRLPPLDGDRPGWTGLGAELSARLG
jgi:Asp/Glu/hydantoin racemase